MKTIDWIFIAVIAVAFVFALRATIKHKGCPSSCEGCAMKDKCHKSRP